MAEALPRPATPTRASAQPIVLETRGLSVWVGRRQILRGIDLEIRRRQVMGIIGPSGAGKTTFLRCLNRLVDLTPAFRVAGEVLFLGRSVRHRGVDADALRARIGMIFQQPVVFPGSIRHNVLFGVRHLRRPDRAESAEILETTLREVSLWEEVADRLGDAAQGLSVGQQQRLCLARALATDPDVLLLDEPTSALDARSAEAIEQLILERRERQAIVLVTHNVPQARRVTDCLACFCVRDGAGELLEVACCDETLEDPRCQAVVNDLRLEP